MKDIESYPSKPWRTNPSITSEYFNYGFNEKTWSSYADKMKKKFDELKTKSATEKWISKEEAKPIKYLYNIPIEYSGLGESLDPKSNINYFESTRKINPPLVEMRSYVPCVALTSTEQNSSNRGFHLLLHATNGTNLRIENKVGRTKEDKRRNDSSESVSSGRKRNRNNNKHYSSKSRSRDRERGHKDRKDKYYKSRSRDRTKRK